MRDNHLTMPRLIAYVTLWGDINDVELNARLEHYSALFKSVALDARLYEYGRDNSGNAIVAVRFNGADIDKLAECLDVTAGDLLSREVGLGNPYETRGE